MVALRRLVPSLALAIKCASLARIAGALVEVYLGHDAGQRVLKGRISRGVAEQIHAVLWYSEGVGFSFRRQPSHRAPNLPAPLDKNLSARPDSCVHAGCFFVPYQSRTHRDAGSRGRRICNYTLQLRQRRLKRKESHLNEEIRALA